MFGVSDFYHLFIHFIHYSFFYLLCIFLNLILFIYLLVIVFSYFASISFFLKVVSLFITKFISFALHFPYNFIYENILHNIYFSKIIFFPFFYYNFFKSCIYHINKQRDLDISRKVYFMNIRY